MFEFPRPKGTHFLLELAPPRIWTNDSWVTIESMVPRKPQLLTAHFPYHVTARSNNKEWFYLPSSQVWTIMTENLAEITDSYNARIISFVLMSNHFHMLIQTPSANLDSVMNYFMREVSRGIGRIAGRINHVFGGRYKPSLITEPGYFAHAYKYVYRNPVRGSIVQRVQDYPFSTVSNLISPKVPDFKIFDLDCALSYRVPKEFSDRLEWLNTPLSKEQEALIAKGLRRVEFSFPKHKKYRRLVQQLQT